MNKPAAKLRDGVLQVTIWGNTTEEGKTFYSVQLIRSYKDGEDWKETDSLNVDDCLKASRLLERAYDKILDLKSA